MRYIIDVSQKHSNLIDRLINEGLYVSINQFINTSIENQLLIEQLDTSSNDIGSSVKQLMQTSVLISNDKEQGNMSISTLKPDTVNAPLFTQLDCGQQVDEENCWMWGQYNRIFPIKIALRLLVNRLSEGMLIELEEFKEQASNIASAYYSMLNDYEMKINANRNHKVSTGLPKTSNDASQQYKSHSRFKEHFIGSMRKDGKLTGAMPFLKFANFIKDKSGRTMIGITETGYEFATLENPIIEHKDYSLSISSHERDYYMRHIKNNVAGEYNAMRWLVEQLNKGISTPEALNNAIKKTFNKLWDTSDAVINTQRAGLLGRMYELKFINKKKDGVQVSYSVSDLCNNYFNINK